MRLTADGTTQIWYGLVPNSKNPLRKGPRNGRQLKITADLQQLSGALTDFVTVCTTTQFTAPAGCRVSKPEPEIQSLPRPTGRPPVAMPRNCHFSSFDSYYDLLYFINCMYTTVKNAAYMFVVCK